MDPAVLVGAPIVLRGGSRVRIRQLRGGDGELLENGFERLSEESRYRRFLSPMPKLSGATLRHLIEIDHRDHDAVIALDEDCGEAVGVARYVRDPVRPRTAEVAVSVIDDWQARGLGTLLLDAITLRARDEGVEVFTALMLASNREMRRLLQRLGAVRVVDETAGTVEVEVPLPVAGISPALRRLIRIAAASGVAIPIGQLPSRAGGWMA